MGRRSLFVVPAFAVSLFLGGCASQVSNIAVSETFDTNKAYTFEHWIDTHPAPLSNGDLIVLSFSGGGSRAAALSASVLEQPKHMGLSEKIALISSTSGGSVTAGYYAAAGNEGMGRFKKDFLAKDNTSALARKIVPGFLYGANRSGLFADYIDEGIFQQLSPDKRLTYADLIKRWPAAPFVVMNATDASTGATFELTQEYFSHLCSDLGAFRVSEGMAASSSFPFLMTPIPLQNHWNNPACPKVIDSYAASYAAANRNRYLNLKLSSRRVTSTRCVTRFAMPAGRRPQQMGHTVPLSMFI